MPCSTVPKALQNVFPERVTIRWSRLAFRLKVRVIPLLLILALSALASFPGGSAVNACLGQCWYSVSPPVFTHLGWYQAFKTTWVNLGNANVTGVVVMVIH